MVGSLLPGSLSASPKPNKQKTYDKQSSFTKKQIEAFWRARHVATEMLARNAELDQALEDMTDGNALGSSSNSLDPNGNPIAEDLLLYGNPFTDTDPETMTDEEKAARVKDWWTKSDHAALNTPPEKGLHEGKKGYSYQAQHHLSDKLAESDHHEWSVPHLPSAMH